MADHVFTRRPSISSLHRPLCSWRYSAHHLAAFFLVFRGAAAGERYQYGAPLLPRAQAPLHTEGRYIVSRGGERVKWACLNWYGAYSPKHVVGGLEIRPLSEIVERAAELGFNCIRVCYSTQAHIENPLIEDDAVEANLDLFQGKRFIEVLDATVNAITQAGLMVIINNHNHKTGWCCHYTQDEGLWYTPDYPESVWIASLVNMTLRYRSNPLVVAIDLRNEVHDYQDTVLTWGDGDPKTDWGAAATRAGNAVLAVNPDVLIVVMALCFGMELRPAREHPIQLSVPNRVVYQSHNYLEYQFWSLISATFTSWESIQTFSAVMWVSSTLVAIMLALAWDALRRPKPTLNGVLVYSGVWFFALMALSAAVSAAMYSLTRPYCGYWAIRDMLPAVYAFGPLSLVGVAVSIAGCVRHYRCHSAGDKNTSQQNGVDPFSGSFADVVTIGKSSIEERENLTPTSSRYGRRDPAGASAPEAPPRLFGSPGCSSCCVAFNRLFRFSRREKEVDPRGMLPEVEWDMGLCCGLQCLILAAVLTVALGVLFIFACFAPSYQLLDTHFDRMWGFALEEGYPYSAPVWMGEFGNPRRGTYWINFMRYLREHDVDYAYWALNGLKWGEGWINTNTGQWIEYDEPRWENESFGIFNDDYWTVRSAWRLLDLQALMMPPIDHFAVMKPCDRDVLGSQCGG